MAGPLGTPLGLAAMVILLSTRGTAGSDIWCMCLAEEPMGQAGRASRLLPVKRALGLDAVFVPGVESLGCCSASPVR